MIDFNFPLDRLKPASYNPRKISESQFIELQDSIKKIGVIKPIIVRSDMTIIAGHQRTKAMKSIGLTNCPAYIIDNINIADESRFNQFHNAADIEIGSKCPNVLLTGDFDEGWNYVKPSQVLVIDKGGNAAYDNELMKLLMKYGQFGASVVDSDNRVIISSSYAKACKLLNIDLLIYKPNAEKIEIIKDKFSKEYGVFSYDNVPKNTYAQTYAQMNRLKGIKSRKITSRLYEKRVLPCITKDLRILDFGAGKKAYVEMLKQQGFNIFGIEFYLRNGNNIDVRQVNKDINDVINDVNKNGLYDVVICDSVLNSVDSENAERAVMETCNAFCKSGGMMLISGRPVDNRADILKKKSDPGRNIVYFLDDKNFSANFRNGFWFYQHFHTYATASALAEKYIGEYKIFVDDKDLEVNRFNGEMSFQICGKKIKDISIEEKRSGITYEFTLPLPNNKKYDREIDMLKALKILN